MKREGEGWEKCFILFFICSQRVFSPSVYDLWIAASAHTHTHTHSLSLDFYTCKKKKKDHMRIRIKRIPPFFFKAVCLSSCLSFLSSMRNPNALSNHIFFPFFQPSFLKFLFFFFAKLFLVCFAPQGRRRVRVKKCCWCHWRKKEAE